MEKKRFRVIDNHIQSRNLIVYANDKNEALSIGSSKLSTCNIRVIELTEGD
jgi:hypothetical protein